MHAGELSVRKPEAISLGRMTSFNKANDGLFSKILRRFAENMGQFRPIKFGIWMKQVSVQFKDNLA